MNNCLLIVFVTLLILASGCAWLPVHQEPIERDQSQLIAIDLVNALSRVQGYAPRNTMVQIRPATSEFAQTLESALRDAGYGLQSVSKDAGGAMLVSFEQDTYENDAGKSVGYRIKVGDIELAREYEVRGGRVFPMTALSITGVTMASTPLDRSIFDRNRQDESKNNLTPASQRVTDQAHTSDHDQWQDVGGSLRERMNQLQPLSGSPPITTPNPNEQSPFNHLAETVPKRNMMELGRSNYAQMLQGYDTEREITLVFPNDSLRLGERNKKRLANFAQGFDADQQMISVVGCSNGPSKIKNGNELLAIGRANRVKEELIILDVPTDKVLDEGCWASSAQTDIPNRAVIVSLRQSQT